MKCPPLAPLRACKKNKMSAAVHINGCRNNSDNPALRSPLLSARTPGPVPSSAPYMTSANPTVLDSEREFLLPLSRDCVSSLRSLFVCFTFVFDILHRCGHAQEFPSGPEEGHWPGYNTPVSLFSLYQTFHVAAGKRGKHPQCFLEVVDDEMYLFS